jgi:hypothetical protein
VLEFIVRHGFQHVLGVEVEVIQNWAVTIMPEEPTFEIT